MSVVLRRDRGDLLHKQLYLALREQIRRGVYALGDAIPTEEQLCKDFGVSRITVRRAVADLAEEGWVEKRLGRGTFVSKSMAPAAQRAKSTFTDSLAKRSKQTQVTVIEVTRGHPPAHVAQVMGIPADAEVVSSSRVRSIAGVPLLFVDSWVVAEHAGHISEKSLRTSSMTETLLAGGVRIRYVTEEITAVTADPHVAGILKVEVGVPLLCVSRLVSKDAGKPVMYLNAYLTSERSRIVFDYEEKTLERMYDGKLIHHLPEPGNTR